MLTKQQMFPPVIGHCRRLPRDRYRSTLTYLLILKMLRVSWNFVMHNCMGNMNLNTWRTHA